MSLFSFVGDRVSKMVVPLRSVSHVSTCCPYCLCDQSTTCYDFGREQILRCTSCELMYLSPLPSEEDLRAIYGDTYFQNGEFLKGENDSLFGYVDYIAERFNKQWQYAYIVRDIHRYLGPRADHPRLLEVGCGFGYFLDVAFEEGFAVTGVEFSRFAVDRLRQKYTFPIVHGALETATFQAGVFDVAAMFDVIEHLRNPFGALDRLYSALAPRGLLVLSTLDADSWVSRLLGKRLEDFRRTREHLFFFSRRTLSRVLQEHGFEVLSICSVGHTFSLALLLDRLALYNRPLFVTLRQMVTKLGLGSLQLKVNPHTKMLLFARRRD